MQSFQINDKNISVTMNYLDLQKMLKETVMTTMKMVNEEAKKKESQKWFDTSQTAQVFGVHCSTINRWKHSGYLTPRTIGGKDYFSIEQINNILVTNNKMCA